DCHVHMLREADGGFSFELEVIQRYVKGRRKDENDNIHIVLNSAKDLQRNGIMFFFVMAIADKAFKCYETLGDLMRARLPRDRDSWTLERKDDACERPVLRMACTNGVHKTRALTFAALRDQIVSLGKRVGYRDNVKVHAIRASVANKIKDPEIRKRLLGHKSTEIYDRHYASKIVDVSEYLGETSSTKNIEMLRSMNHRRDRHAPRDLPRKEQDEFDQSPEVQELKKSIAEATAKMGDKPDKNSAQFKERQKGSV
ncbi:hypothetical protein V502_03243, partial [Pseudogymnoascus sp. VKM F-4520 (FW-2644)]